MHFTLRTLLVQTANEMVVENLLIVDNGAYSIKAGYAVQKSPRVMPNAIMKTRTDRKRVFVGGEIDECTDKSSLFYLLPMQRGYLVNFDTEQKVWEYLFGPRCLNAACSSTTVLLTEPYFNFATVQEDTLELLFEAFGFQAVARTQAATLVGQHYGRLVDDSLQCCVVVDSGYSFSHVVPFIEGKVQKQAIVRVDAGGKLLTNQLKEAISYRQLVVMEETYVMNECKHQLCYVSQNFDKDLHTASLRGTANHIARDYVLPDFGERHHGEVRAPAWTREQAVHGSNEQIVRMNHERFTIPELLFRPHHVGLQQMGIAEATAYAINKCHADVRDRLFANVVLCGGNTNFDGYAQRFITELQSCASAPVRVRTINEVQGGIKAPIEECAWRAGAALVDKIHAVPRAQYDEEGKQALARSLLFN